jgi:acetoin:2,6-dichlorophenolindophenol oxidoreductase subunit beta
MFMLEGASRPMSFAEALIDGLHYAMAADPRITLIGSYILGLGPQRHHFERLRNDFGNRISDPPIAEAAIGGLGAGAAMAGHRPMIDFTTASFSLLSMLQVTHEAGVARLMSGGQLGAPVVYHMLHGVRGGGSGQHSASPQAMFWNSPGLEVVLPASPRDVKGLIRRAFNSENPTIVLNHAKLMDVLEDVPVADYEIPFGQADIKREGSDVTIVSSSWMTQLSLEAARTLAERGISAEVVDLRTVSPLDEERLLASVAKTGRLVAVDECPLRCGIASEIVATVCSSGVALKAPPQRVARADVPIPTNPGLEAALTPDRERIVAAALATLARASEAEIA